MSQSLVCPKCNGRMEDGILLDHTQHSAFTQSKWVAGTPERSFWTGLKVDDRAQYPVTTYRCTACGFLELYSLSASETLLRSAEGASATDPAILLRPSASDVDEGAER